MQEAGDQKIISLSHAAIDAKRQFFKHLIEDLIIQRLKWYRFLLNGAAQNWEFTGKIIATGLIVRTLSDIVRID